MNNLELWATIKLWTDYYLPIIFILIGAILYVVISAILYFIERKNK